MKKTIPLLLLLVVLSGCGRDKLDGMSGRIRDLYSNTEAISMNVAMRTDYGDHAVDFELKCVQTQKNKLEMEVLSPDIIKGVIASASDAGINLAYDGVILEMGELPGTGLSPLETLPYMMGQWSEGYQTSEGFEKLSETDCIRLIYKTSNAGVAVEQHVWFDTSTLKPIVSELYSDGSMTARCVYSDVVFG